MIYPMLYTYTRARPKMALAIDLTRDIFTVMFCWQLIRMMSLLSINTVLLACLKIDAIVWCAFVASATAYA